MGVCNGLLRTRVTMEFSLRVLLVLMMAGCTGENPQLSGNEHGGLPPGSSGGLTADSDTLENQPGPFPLPSPSTMYSRLHGAKDASSLLEHTGAGFEPALSQRTAADGDNAVFDSTWENGYSPFANVAYATYRFDLTARLGRIRINTQWTHPPATPPFDYARLWLGASNWGRDCWDWYSGAPEGNIVTEVDSLEWYRHAGTGEMYVVVILLANPVNQLERVWLDGFSLRGDWWMYGRDAQHTNSSPFKGPDYPELMWATSNIQGFDTAPLDAQGGPVYDADGDIFYSFRAASPQFSMYAITSQNILKWYQQFIMQNGTTNDRTRGAGCPAIANDGTIYTPASDMLYAFRPDGTTYWTFDSPMPILKYPAIGPDGTVYVLAENNSNDPPAVLQAVDPSGNGMWEYGITETLALHGAPAVGPDGTIYVNAADYMYAINPNGVLYWEYALGGIHSISEAAIGADGQVYFTSGAPGLYALDPGGNLAWQQPLPGASSDAAHPALGHDGVVYAAAGTGGVSAAEPGGALRWTYPCGAAANAPVVDSAGTVYVSCQDARLYAIDNTGSLKWWLPTFDTSCSSVSIAEDGTLYFFACDKLWAYGPGNQLSGHGAAGYVRDGGAGIPGVTISISGEDPVLTDADGYWSASGLTDGAYLVSPTKDGMEFNPRFALLEIDGSDAEVADFTGRPASSAPWPMLGYDRAHTRRSPYSVPASPVLRWAMNFGDAVLEEPVIGVDGAVYLRGLNIKAGCLEPDGTPRWTLSPLRETTRAALGLGADSTVYISGTSAFYAVSPAGSVKWSLAASNSTSPVPAADGSIIVLTSGAFNHSNPVIASLSPAGLVNWGAYPGGILQYGQNTAAIAVDGSIYAGSRADWLFAANADGTDKWKQPVNDGGASHDPYVPYPTTIAISESGVLYMGYGLNFYAFGQDGTQLWVYPLDAPCVTDAAIGADGTIYFGKSITVELDKNELVALHPDGTLYWEYYADSCSFTGAPTVDASGAIYVGVTDSMLALEPDGTVRWRFDQPVGDVSGPSIGADGTLYFGDAANYVYALGSAL